MNKTNEKILTFLCHEMNRTYNEFLGDRSIPQYHEAPAWMLENTMDGISYIMANPLTGPAGLHEHWVQHMMGQGWVFGKIKDVDEKIHPALVSWNDLPYDKKISEVIFYNLVRSYIAAINTLVGEE